MPFFSRTQPTTSSSFRVNSVIRVGGVGGTASSSPPLAPGTPNFAPSAIDSLHEADGETRARLGRASPTNPDGLHVARGFRPCGEHVPIRWVAVFCGTTEASAYGHDAAYLGAHLAAQGWGILYGGNQGGQASMLAAAALRAGGWVIGVDAGGPTHWEQYPAPGQEGLLHTPSLDARKLAMLKPARGAVALAGGWDTLDDVAFVMRATSKPIAVVNGDGFYAPLFALANRMRQAGFIARHNVPVEVRDPRVVTEFFVAPSDATVDSPTDETT